MTMIETRAYRLKLQMPYGHDDVLERLPSVVRKLKEEGFDVSVYRRTGIYPVGGTELLLDPKGKNEFEVEMKAFEAFNGSGLECTITRDIRLVLLE